MSLKQLLADQGIITKKLQPGSYHIDCPKPYCKAARPLEDNACLELVIVDKGHAHWKCRNCLWTAHAGEREERTPHHQPEQEQVSDKPAGAFKASDVAKFLAARGVSADSKDVTWDAERHQIKILYRMNGEAVNALLLDPGTGISRLASKKRVMFFGLDKLELGDTKSATLIIAHRELDALALQAQGFANVLGLPNGGDAGGTEEQYGSEADPLHFLGDRSDIFEKSGRVILALDNTPSGDKLRTELVRRIGAAKCWNVKFYSGTLAETQRAHGSDFVCQDINDALPQPIRGIYEVDDFMSEVLAYFDQGMSAGVSTGYANVDMLYTVLPAQLTVITGIPNSGKSTWLDALMVNLSMMHGWVHAVFSPENPKALHVIKLTQKRVKQPSNPKHPNRMTRETLMSGAAWVKDYFKFIVSESNAEPPTLDWLLARASDAVLRYGVRGVALDPWNRIVKTYAQGENESAYVERALAQILRFATSHQVHVWLVAHPTKQEPDKKTGNFSVPSLYSISGGANFPNMMDNGIVIYRPPGMDNKHITEFWTRKIRFDHVGETGHTRLKFDSDTGCFEPVEEQEAVYSQAGVTPAAVGIKTYPPE